MQSTSSHFPHLAKLATILLALASLSTYADAAAILQKRVEPPQKLPKRATDNDAKYQPAIDFDTDSCYNVPAIGCDGYISEGLPIDDLTSGCREPKDLDNSNVYSRQRCNSGWCVYMYDYYFEKDYASPGVGHRHDWEHILVWVPDSETDGTEKYVCGSAHGGWSCREGSRVRWHNGDHPKMVYHKDGAQTHAWRFANSDDDNVENDKHEWQLADLVSWNGFPSSELRDKLASHDFGSASFALGKNFQGNLQNAITSDCSDQPTDNPVCDNDNFPYEFDPATDTNGSPGTPAPNDGCNPGGGDPPPQTSFKVMIVGDSITQGFEGDWTWRFRLDTWLNENNLAVEHVGAWVGTHTNADPTDPKPPHIYNSAPAPSDPPRTDGLYAYGATWDTHHWALWGRQAEQVKGEIRSQVNTYKPDWLLVMLGFNDLGWFVTGPEGLLSSMKTIVDEARAANPNIKILLANVVHRTYLEGRDDLVENTNRYNIMLPGATPSWYTDQSPVVWVDVNSAYSCSPHDGCDAAYDGLHPNEYGEYQIASAFSKALVNEFKIGSSPIAVPDKNDDGIKNGKSPKVPSNLRVSSAPWGLKIEWDKQFGANAYEVRSRLVGQVWGYWPAGIAWPVNRWDSSWVLDGQEWEYSVRTNMGIDRVSDWSSAVKAVAHPTNPQGPHNVWTEPRGNNEIFISWDPVPGAVLYEVITFDQEAGADVVQFPNGRGIEGTSVTLNDGLVAGHRHGIAIVTWVSSGPGWPSVGLSVRVGSGTPGAVSGLQVSNIDPTTVQLSWPAVPAAAIYRVWFRNFKNNEVFRTDDYSFSDTNSHGIGFLYPGTWNFEFYVVALNGNLTSSPSNVVVPPVYPGFET